MCKYFVSFAVCRPVPGFGNCQVKLERPLKNMEDIRIMRESIEQDNLVEEDRGLVILFYKRFEEGLDI